MKKRCTTCREPLALSDFPKNGRKGLRNQCKLCRRQRRAELANRYAKKKPWRLVRPAPPPSTSAAYRKRHADAGICINCAEPATFGTRRCEKHREMHNRKARIARRRATDGVPVTSAALARMGGAR